MSGPPRVCTTAATFASGVFIGRTHPGPTIKPVPAVDEAKDAIAQTAGTGLIVGPGCVLPMNTPDANVAAVVQTLGGPLKKIPGVTT